MGSALIGSGVLFGEFTIALIKNIFWTNLQQWRKVYVVLRRASFRGPQRLEKYNTEQSSDLTRPGYKPGKVEY